MNGDDWFVVILVVVILALFALLFVPEIMDDMSATDCEILGYDGGDQLFWQGRTVCYSVVQEEVKEYFYLERGK